MAILSTTLRLELAEVSEETDALIHERMMRPQQSAMRTAYNRLLEGMEEKDIYALLTPRFPTLTSWDIKSAIKQAGQTIASQKELFPAHIEYLKKKVERLERRFIERPAIKPKLVRVTRQLVEAEALQRRGELPRAIFGGAALYEKTRRGLAGAKEAWRFERSNEYYTIGGSSAYGNRQIHLSLAEEDGTAEVMVRIPGADREGEAYWAVLPARYTRKQRNLLAQVANQHVTNTTRLMRIAPRRYRLWVTIQEDTGGRVLGWDEPVGRDGRRCAGIDLNLNCLAVAIINADGGFCRTDTLNYNNLGELPQKKSKPMIGNIAADLVDWLQRQGVASVVLEDLKFFNEPDAGKKINRSTVPFSHRQLHEAVVRRAVRKGLRVKLVNPAYTSWIGKLKYADQYSISVHNAAAYVIARRGMGFREDLNREVIERIPKVVQVLETEIDKKKKPADKAKLRAKANVLKHWKQYTPRAGRPWKLWATLLATVNSLSAARAALSGGCSGETTVGRKDICSRQHSADHIRLGTGLGAAQAGNSPGTCPNRGTRRPGTWLRPSACD